jgi:L-lactate dehydrogenase complex protein LldF
MLGGAYHEMLRCIRCGACLNHCPVYGAVGGHAYGWVYPGPMGAVLTPLMVGLEEGRALPNASTLCGRCEEVCPMSIPLPKLLREHRRQEFARQLSPPRSRWALAAWAFCARRPQLYRWVMRAGVVLLNRLSGGRGGFRNLPLAQAWTAARDLPAPQRDTFMAQWQRRSKP